jgi:RimJ/RimL family protein N-acetyltransferase
MITHTDIRDLSKYIKHLKSLSPEDKYSRFGYAASDYAIDQFALQILYSESSHKLWYHSIDDEITGWGHLVESDNDVWELAVSVNSSKQRQGIGNKLIIEMLEYAKFHNIHEVFMNCIEDNRVIQHLALKNNLKTKSRDNSERTAIIEVSPPNFFEKNAHKLKEQTEILQEIAVLRNKLAELWVNSFP